MSPGCFPGEVFQACQMGRKPLGRRRTRWRDYDYETIKLGVPPEKMVDVAGEREAWVSLLRTLQLGPG